MMKNNKLITIMLIILVSITLIGVVAFVVITQLNKGTAKQVENIDDIIAASVDVDEVTTNLADDSYVKIALKIQTSSKDAAAELKKRDFQVKSILIDELSEMSKKDLDGVKGKEMLENALKTKINELMQDGEVQKVYITSYIIQ